MRNLKKFNQFKINENKLREENIDLTIQSSYVENGESFQKIDDIDESELTDKEISKINSEIMMGEKGGLIEREGGISIVWSVVNTGFDTDWEYDDFDGEDY